MMKRNSLARRGAVAVEMALTLPLLILLMLASFELAKANFLRHAARAAAYEGARVGILPGATPAKVEEAAQFVMRTMGSRHAQITTTPANLNPSVTRVRVEVTVDTQQDMLFTPYFFRNVTFQGSCELSREVW